MFRNWQKQCQPILRWRACSDKPPGRDQKGVLGSEVGPTHRAWCGGGALLSKMTEANCHVSIQIKQHKIVFRIDVSLLKAM